MSIFLGLFQLYSSCLLIQVVTLFGTSIEVIRFESNLNEGKSMGQEIQTIHHFSHWVQQKFHKEVMLERVASMDMSNDGIENDLVLPVVYKDIWLSQVRIKNGQYLGRFDQHQISHFVELQLAPSLYKQLLDLQLNNLKTVTQQEFETQGLQLFGGQNESQEAYFEENRQQSFAEGYKEPFTICLYGKDGFRHRKIANEIHHLLSHRWALVNYKDIAADITHIDQIFDLGAMTLYVDHVQNFEVRDIDLLNQYLIKKHGDFKPRQETPLFIFSGKTKDEFKTILNSITLEIDQDYCFRTENWPMKSEQIRDILDLLLT
ncbi:MAG: hypothetical protein ACK5WZ_08980 [Pseudobdellovibrionaceae bacterium]